MQKKCKKICIYKKKVVPLQQICDIVHKNVFFDILKCDITDYFMEEILVLRVEDHPSYYQFQEYHYFQNGVHKVVEMVRDLPKGHRLISCRSICPVVID